MYLRLTKDRDWKGDIQNAPSIEKILSKFFKDEAQDTPLLFENLSVNTPHLAVRQQLP